MNPRLLGKVCSPLIVTGLCLLALRSQGAEVAAAPLADAAAEWVQVEKLQAAMHARPEWQGREPKPEDLSAFQIKIRTTALELAKKARWFATRFPTNESAGDARFLAALGMCRAVAAGDTASESEVKRFEAETLADLSIPEDERIAVILGAGNLPMTKKLGMKLFTEQSGSFFNEHEESFKASAREIIRRFPASSQGYSSLLAIAERAKGAEKKQLVQELIDMSHAVAVCCQMLCNARCTEGCASQCSRFSLQTVRKTQLGPPSER